MEAFSYPYTRLQWLFLIFFFQIFIHSSFYDVVKFDTLRPMIKRLVSWHIFDLMIMICEIWCPIKKASFYILFHVYVSSNIETYENILWVLKYFRRVSYVLISKEIQDLWALWSMGLLFIEASSLYKVIIIMLTRYSINWIVKMFNDQDGQQINHQINIILLIWFVQL